MTEPEIPQKEDFFVDPDGEPYIFYLMGSLKDETQIIRGIQEHGGRVVPALSRNCILIADDRDEIPAEVGDNHVYSVRAILDSIDNGSLQPFENYYLHIPESEAGPQTWQGDDSRVTSEAEQRDRDRELEQDVQAVVEAQLGSAMQEVVPVQPKRHGVNYFTPDEDAYLLEEIRKRPWMGYKGHQIYKEIADLQFFRDRHRTGASLRERIRTLKYNVGYVYVADKNHNLVRDEEGKYITSNVVDLKVKMFSADDDFILCKVIYQQLRPRTNEKGFETVMFPTNFFDKFSQVFSQHPSESWRQRYKNYLSIFGIANYLKYYIIQRQQGQAPLSTNSVNKEWLRARRAIRKTDGPRLYFPNIPVENQFIDENIDSIRIPMLEEKDLNGFAPITWNLGADRNEITSSVEEPLAKRQHTAVDDVEIDTIPESALTMPDVLPVASLGVGDTEGDGGASGDVTGDDSDVNGNWETLGMFLDEPTDKPTEGAFLKAYRTYGEPIDLEEVLPRRKEFLQKVGEVLDTKGLSGLQQAKKLAKVGIRKFYTVFVQHRCNSDNELIKESIANYLDTKGKQWLALTPGVWSNKALRWLEEDNEHLDNLLKDYHGEESFNKELKNLHKTGLTSRSE